MVDKLSRLCRTLYIVLAVVAGFMALGTMNTPLVLLVLGLIAGLTLPQDRLVTATVTLLALPILGTALTNIPQIGDRLNAVMLNLQMGMAGAVVTALVIRLYGLAMEGVTGMTAPASSGGRKKAAA